MELYTIHDETISDGLSDKDSNLYSYERFILEAVGNLTEVNVYRVRDV